MYKFNLAFSQDQLQVLNMALGEIPHKLAGPMVSDINTQIATQQKSELDAQEKARAEAARSGAAETEEKRPPAEPDAAAPDAVPQPG